MDQGSEASERANHIDILQKFIPGKVCIKCEELEVRARGGGIAYIRSRKEVSVIRFE